MLKVRCLVIVLREMRMLGHVDKPQSPSNIDSSKQIHHFYWGPSQASGKIGNALEICQCIEGPDDEALPQCP